MRPSLHTYQKFSFCSSTARASVLDWSETVYLFRGGGFCLLNFSNRHLVDEQLTGIATILYFFPLWSAATSISIYSSTSEMTRCFHGSYFFPLELSSLEEAALAGRLIFEFHCFCYPNFIWPVSAQPATDDFSTKPALEPVWFRWLFFSWSANQTDSSRWPFRVLIFSIFPSTQQYPYWVC